jgi:hypothetical protein
VRAFYQIIIHLGLAGGFVDRLIGRQADFIFQAAESESSAIGFGRLQVDADIVGVEKLFGNAPRAVRVGPTGGKYQSEQYDYEGSLKQDIRRLPSGHVC